MILPDGCRLVEEIPFFGRRIGRGRGGVLRAAGAQSAQTQQQQEGRAHEPVWSQNARYKRATRACYKEATVPEITVRRSRRIQARSLDLLNLRGYEIVDERPEASEIDQAAAD